MLDDRRPSQFRPAGHIQGNACKERALELLSAERFPGKEGEIITTAQYPRFSLLLTDLPGISWRVVSG
jgi:hypothetical protein